MYALRSIAAAHTGDRQAAEENYKNLKKTIEKKSAEKNHLEDYRRRKWKPGLLCQGRQKKADKKLIAAANKQDEEDSGDFTVPARERCWPIFSWNCISRHKRWLNTKPLLKISPNRFNDLYGAASAAQMAGDSSKAKSYYSKLRENCPANR